MARVRDGALGWLASLLPLVVVNILGYLGYFDTQDALIAGALALLGGLVLGGVVAGTLSGRARVKRRKRVSPRAPDRWWTAAATAGGLYVVTLLSLITAAMLLGVGPDIVAMYPAPVVVAIVCLGSVVGKVMNASMSSGPLPVAQTHFVPPASIPP